MDGYIREGFLKDDTGVLKVTRVRKLLRGEQEAPWVGTKLFHRRQAGNDCLSHRSNLAPIQKARMIEWF